MHERDTVAPLTRGDPAALVFGLTVSANLFRGGHRLLEIDGRTDVTGQRRRAVRCG